jgi:hypothetical protein
MRSAAFTAALLLLPVRAALGAECNVLTPADIKAVTGADVQAPVPEASAGQGCPPFKQTDGHPYLEVERHRGSEKYQLALKAVPPDIYTRQTPVSGLGDEAVLMSDGTGRLRSLVARKGEVTIVLSPRTYDKIVGGKLQQKISDAQLKQLAERALATR